MKYNELEHSSISLRTHEEDQCAGESCTIHNRSDHHMRHFPQFYHFGRSIMERKCTHGIGHPDPDEIKIINGMDDGKHDCDGCCFRFATEEEYKSARVK